VAPPVTVIHERLLEAVHAQPAPAVTENEAVSPPAGDVLAVGDNVYEHAEAPDCVTVNVCPAMVIVPVRCVVTVLAATVNATVPLPAPLPPLVTLSHAALLVAVHTQELPAVTAVEAVSPAAGDVLETGDSEYAQPGTPGCVTAKVLSAMLIVPVRSVVPVLGATSNVTVPSPDPLAPPVTLSHVA
jgi:hypothetical protein